MLTILIADDQREEREGIEFLIHELGFSLQIETAENGRKALEVLERQSIDILFTDVRMPIMDGLQLTMKALALQPELKVILFSGFAEFEYAKRAISLGVSDYLLKPINVEAFQTIMQKVMLQLTEQKQETIASRIIQGYVRKHVLFQLVNGLGIPTSMKDASLELPDHYQGMILLEFEKNFFENAEPEFEDFILSIVKGPVDYLNLNGCQSLLLFPNLQTSASCSSRELGMIIHDKILEKYRVNGYLAVHEEPTKPQELNAAVVQLDQLMEYRFFTPDHYLFDKTTVGYGSDELLPDLSDNDLIQQIKLNLKERDLFSLRANSDLLYQKYSKQVQFSQLYVKHMFATLYQEISSHAAPLSESEWRRGIETIYLSEELKEIHEIMITGIARLEQEHSNSEFLSRDIAAVKQYIEDHYGEDLSLELLAAKVHLSPHYLSSIFKKNTGCGLNKYIKNVRMNKARDMLEQTHLKVSDICYQVGFQNVSYFCQNYRDFFGQTPEKFRQFHPK
ncbi:response regulator [Gorillibacterium timonense]|uniref:response regulator n=1 Tax=Gorillibacterium timonense TaxID=1689269 RepID=UPI00071DD650|nr:response regulator [Gorillibacterium timonense]